MKRRLFHLYLKSTLEHKYYGSLKGIFIDTTNPDLGVSKFTLDRFDFVQPYENEVCVIRKGFMQSTGHIREAAK